MDAMGGPSVGANGQAAFDNSANAPQATAILQALHQMRFVDHSMSPTQQLAWGTLQQQIAANKLGRNIAAPDDIYNTIAPLDHANANAYRIRPLTSTIGPPARPRSAGSSPLLSASDTP